MNTEQKLKRRAWQKAQDEAYKKLSLLRNSSISVAITLIKEAEQSIKEQILLMPLTEWEAYRLPQLRAQIQQILTELEGSLSKLGGTAANSMWSAGIDMLYRPLVAVKLIDAARLLPELDISPITNIKAHLLERLSDIPRAIAGKINATLGLVSMSVLSRTRAIKNIADVLLNGGKKRARTILTTELSRISQTANQAARVEAAKKLPNLKKQWKHGHPRQSRATHAAADGQIVAYNKSFQIGTIKMMFPHDPTAPASEVINCTCHARDYLSFD